MSVQKENMLLGAGELYIANIRIGNLKDAAFVYTKEFVEAKPGNGINIVRRDITKESAVLTGTLCDIDIERVPMLMGLTMSTTQLTGTTTLRITEEIQLGASTTTWKTLAEHAVSVTNPMVYSLDYQSKYLDGTDYSLTTSSTLKTKLKPKSTTFKSKYLLVVYDYADKSALHAHVGGKTTHEELKLKFVHTMSNGKRLQITIPKAQLTSEFNLPFSEDAHSTLPVSFTAIGDYTLAKGQRLFTIIKER